MKAWMLIPVTILIAVNLGACSREKAPVTKMHKPKPAKVHAVSYDKLAYCPPVNTLSNKKMHWGAPGGWETRTPSFSTVLSRFVGAQWKGYVNGKIICIYAGNSNDFDIALQTNRMVGAPSNSNWVLDSENAIHQKVYNCASNEPKQCGFPIDSTQWEDKNAAPAAGPINLDQKVEGPHPQADNF